MRYKFTLFTPTYNRAYTLKRVFDSLMAQTIEHSSFEWILVDDGSTDDTQELADKFISEADFDIRYVKQSNHGKNYSHNKAVAMAEGELFLILDSDDEIVAKCMEIFWNYWSQISSDTKENIYGINCLCKDGFTDTLIGHKVEEGLMEDALIWKLKNRVFFETWGALNTKLFKKHLFPEIEGVKFIPESYLWDSVGKNRKIYSTNEILRVVYHQDDGFTNNITKSYINDSKGRYIYHKMVVNDMFFELLRYTPVRLLKDIIQFVRMGLHSNYSLLEILNALDKKYKKIITFFFFSFGYFFYLKDTVLKYYMKVKDV
jgi:glycosyltransferase involved in cell wall biosynthesis